MDTERLLVSRMVTTGQIEEVVARGINEDHFANEECQEVFTSCVAHVMQYKTPPSMKAVKSKHKGFEFELTEDSIEYLMDEFIVKVKRRMANEMLMELASAAEDPARARDIDIEFLDVGRQLATIVPTTSVARFSDMDGRIEKYHKDKEEGNVWGIKMGIPAIDEKTFGIQPHELIICAGFQGRGKSTLMQFITFNAYLQGKKVLFVSLEMEHAALLRKFDTMAVNMTYKDLKGLELDDEAMEKWKTWAENVKEGKENDGKDIMIIDKIGSRTALGIFAETVRYKPDLVVVDYISLLDTQKTGNDQHWQKIGDISRDLKANARTLGVPVLAAAQTNRDSTKEGVKLETIAFSSSIGMDADIVLGLNQDEDMKENEQMEVDMVKNRDGAPAKALMSWVMNTMQFGERPASIDKEVLGKDGKKSAVGTKAKKTSETKKTLGKVKPPEDKKANKAPAKKGQPKKKSPGNPFA